MTKQVASGWAVAGRCGLYVGRAQTRKQAIVDHVYLVRFTDDPEVSQFAFSALSEGQKLIWERCRRNGDFVTKVRITYEGPTP